MFLVILLPWLGSFNPHTHEGCDLHGSHGTRYGFRVSIHTPTKGVTSISKNFFAFELVSIHTPTKGVTCGYEV